MTAKILMRQSFSRTTNYVFKDGRSEVIGSRGVMATDPQSAAASFNIQTKMRPDVKRPVGHICVAFHPDDTPKLTNDLMVELCEAYMKGMGIQVTQYLAVRHYDTKHPHFHLVFNRIDDNGKVISDKMWFRRNEKVCKEIKKKYGLTFSPGKQSVNIERLRTNDKKRYQMYMDVKNALDTAETFTQFQALLWKSGIFIDIKKSSEKNEVQGITFMRNGYSIKGSKLDRNLSLFKILDHYKTLKKTKGSTVSEKRIVQLDTDTTRTGAVQKHESHAETQVRELASGLFEGNLGKSQEQDMKDTPKKKQGIRRR